MDKNVTFPYQGSDPRPGGIIGKILSWIDWHTTFKSTVPPPFVTLEFAGVRFGFPWRVNKEWRVWHWRIHILRFDVYNKAYIGFTAMNKKVPATEVAP